MVAGHFTTDLTTSVMEIFGDTSDFISTKSIDPEKVKKYENILTLLEKRKEKWALNEKLSPIDSLRVYGAYSTLYAVFYGISEFLELGIKKKENPKAAKEVYTLIHGSLKLVELVETVDVSLKESKPPSTEQVDEVFHLSRKLYSDAIYKQVIRPAEIRNKEQLVEQLRLQINAYQG